MNIDFNDVDYYVINYVDEQYLNTLGVDSFLKVGDYHIEYFMKSKIESIDLFVKRREDNEYIFKKYDELNKQVYLKYDEYDNDNLNDEELDKIVNESLELEKQRDQIVYELSKYEINIRKINRNKKEYSFLRKNK
jgi:hypothetical protein